MNLIRVTLRRSTVKGAASYRVYMASQCYAHDHARLTVLRSSATDDIMLVRLFTDAGYTVSQVIRGMGGVWWVVVEHHYPLAEQFKGAEPIDHRVQRPGSARVAHCTSRDAVVVTPVHIGAPPAGVVHRHPHARIDGCTCVACRPLERPCDCAGCRQIIAQRNA